MIGNFIYLEYLLLFRDYIATLKKKEALSEIFLPFIIAILSYFFTLPNANIGKLSIFVGYVINFLAILIGFSITSVTILSSESGKRFEMLKKLQTERMIGGATITGHQLILITFIYVIVVEFFTLTYNLVYYLLWINGFLTSYCKFIIAVNIFLLLHIIMLNIRNITSFYFIYWKE